MSTIDYVRAKSEQEFESLNASGLSIGIAVAEWNSEITSVLLEGARTTLRAAGVSSIKVMWVPGTFELTNASARLRAEEEIDAVIAIGCVVRGDTPHFDYICQGASVGMSVLNAMPTPGVGPKGTMGGLKPVIFCVLTTNTMEQARERAGGVLGNKGQEAAEAAIKMCRPVCIVEK
ncbi:MAG: 6,7-dimethyl-8-ribityllumazine synthase [Porphyromonadaceae bacterium]|nr:6,7-dimethyl-8-ribityllumazine synthase [Porphyromonadaceae bacterium]